MEELGVWDQRWREVTVLEPEFGTRLANETASRMIGHESWRLPQALQSRLLEQLEDDKSPDSLRQLIDRVRSTQTD